MQDADEGDTTTSIETLIEAAEQVEALLFAEGTDWMSPVTALRQSARL